MPNVPDCKPEPTEKDDDLDDSHLDDIEEGAGCTEIWEHLAEKRNE
ncbi:MULTISPECIES: hypothetical protein [Natronococcus]|nr:MULTISPECIES: hypothetical protein [Natronococcus]NKE37845.1 hypothetical protein [Natronococcus sp. JC468]